MSPRACVDVRIAMKCTCLAATLLLTPGAKLAANPTPLEPMGGTPAINTLPDAPPDTTAGSAQLVGHNEADPVQTVSSKWSAIDILGTLVEPGTRRKLHWNAGQSFSGNTINTPVFVVRGAKPGPTLCLTAAVHGDELNGVEITRRILSYVQENRLSGTVVGIPIVNLLGFSRGSRYLPDRRDLNRYFPGHPTGSSASRIANVFFENVIRKCDRLVDFHTGSFKRTNLPQLRADLTNPAVRKFTGRFGATAVLHKFGGHGTLRRAATDAGIPAVAFELGEPSTLQLDHVEFGVKAIIALLGKLGMVNRFSLWSEPQPIYYRSRWLRAHRGGILTSTMRVGVRVNEGDVLGVVTNPLNNEYAEILSEFDGRILGRALNQFVLPGFAVFHIGIESRDIDENVDSFATESMEPYYGSDGDDIDEPLEGQEDSAERLVDEELH